MRAFYMRLSFTFYLFAVLIPISLIGQSADSLLHVLPNTVNTEFEEGYPIISADGENLWFSRISSRMNFGRENEADVWMSFRENPDQWSRAINLGAPVNSDRSGRVLAVNAAGTQLYLLRSSVSEGTTSSPEILYSHLYGRRWSTPSAIPISDSLHLGPHSSLSVGPDERFMIISLLNPESFNNYDLYVSQRDYYGEWSTPQPLGDVINSTGEERKVHLASDGRTLYFSSNGHGGLGGTDILRTVRTDESWTSWAVPELLGAPISSTGDDDGFTLSAASRNIFLARKTEGGQQDLYSFPLPDSLSPFGVCLIRGEIIGDTPDLNSLHATFFPGENARTIEKPVEFHASGTFSTILPLEAGRGQLLITMPGYFPESYQFPDTTIQLKYLDTEDSQLTTYLLENRVYENREADIRKVYLRMSEVEDELTEIDRQMSYLNDPGPEGWPQLDSAMLRTPEMTAVREKYEPYFVPGASVGRRRMEEGDSLDQGISRRLHRIRSRFMENYRREVSDAEPSGDAEIGEGDFGPANNFDQYAYRYWERLLNSEGPLVRYRMESEMIGTLLEEEKGKSRQDITKIQALEARLATVREHTEDLQGQQRSVNRQPNITWRDSLNRELAMELNEPYDEELRALLEPRLQEFINLSRRKFNLNRQHLSLEEDLGKQLSQQIEIEQGAMNEVPIPGTALAVPDKPVDRSYRAHDLEVRPVPLEVGRSFELKGVNFVANTASLTPTSFRQLDSLVEVMRKVPQLGMSVTCHTHGYMSHISSQNLTRARARALSEYLGGKGVPSYRLRVRGLGKLKPKTSDKTAYGRRANQRVEVSIFLASG